MDQILRKAEDKMTYLSNDEAFRLEYDAREKALTDERNRLSSAEERGVIKTVRKMLESGMKIHIHLRIEGSIHSSSC